MIKQVRFHRFKQFRDQTFDFRPEGLTLLAGGNNSGKSSILHGLAVWEFCRTAIEMERRPGAFVHGTKTQGLGLGDDQFSPIELPSLRHLWTNLTTQRVTEPDGYTLKIRCDWDGATPDRYLEFALALANDRLFIKATDTNLAAGDAIPRFAYLPPVAGITAREMRQPGAIRRRRIGEGLAGAVLRNLLLDMFEANLRERQRLRAGKSKISDADLRTLRATDPWELLQITLRDTFSAELDLAPFNEEYHSYIQADIVKGTPFRHKLKRHPDYKKRDLMVEGSGFLQWLSVYTLALSPNIQVLLFDEPDAHLHASLQDDLFRKLSDFAEGAKKQVLVATHSTEILRHARTDSIFEVSPSKGRTKYLVSDQQKVGLLAGLGSDYAPRLDRVRRTKRLLFVEGTSDILLLQILAERLGKVWPSKWIEWRATSGHKERRHLFLALQQEVPGLVCVSLRDRDTEPIANVGPRLEDQSVQFTADFNCRKWRRRHIESYLIWPPAIASASGLSEKQIEDSLRDSWGIAVPHDAAAFARVDAPSALLELDGKGVLKEGPDAVLGQIDASVYDVAKAMPSDAIADDIKMLLAELASLESY